MSDAPTRLRRLLGSVHVRAWRLNLHCPDFTPTVPLLRGVFGKALHGIDPATYAAVFEGGPTQTPRYWLCADSATGHAGSSGPGSPYPGSAPADFDFALLLPPDPNTDSAIWSAWDAACRLGLGPRRSPFTITPAPLAWDGTVLSPSRQQPGFGLAGLPWPAGHPARPCRLRFPSPLRLLHNNVLIESPGLPDVMIAALRRACALGCAQGGESEAAAVRADQETWLAAARSTAAGPWRGERHDLHRYSGSQKRDLDLRGATGELLLPAGPGPLAELLAAAAWTHLGKGTVMGMGVMEVVGVAGDGTDQ